MNNAIDVIDLLERDHRMIDGLIEELERADDPAEIRRVFFTIVEELAAHEAAEQEVVFPAFRAKVEASLADPRPRVPHDEAMARIRRILEAKSTKR